MRSQRRSLSHGEQEWVETHTKIHTQAHTGTHRHTQEREARGDTVPAMPCVSAMASAFSALFMCGRRRGTAAAAVAHGQRKGRVSKQRVESSGGEREREGERERGP